MFQSCLFRVRFCRLKRWAGGGHLLWGVWGFTARYLSAPESASPTKQGREGRWGDAKMDNETELLKDDSWCEGHHTSCWTMTQRVFEGSCWYVGHNNNTSNNRADGGNRNSTCTPRKAYLAWALSCRSRSWLIDVDAPVYDRAAYGTVKLWWQMPLASVGEMDPNGP